ncbi:MAG: DUF3789 domain-containing protein [Lachnospiraceae bacterium]|nr:DUF3789 domain-containing protein [Lachnospiraceae bacterium]
MCSFITGFLCFLAGTLMGVMLMCLLQAGRKNDTDRMEGM